MLSSFEQEIPHTLLSSFKIRRFYKILLLKILNVPFVDDDVRSHENYALLTFLIRHLPSHIIKDRRFQWGRNPWKIMLEQEGGGGERNTKRSPSDSIFLRAF
ncbi:hypothetical protein Trydic_g5056 [Trypoxylus dichotomus]